MVCAGIGTNHWTEPIFLEGSITVQVYHDSILAAHVPFLEHTEISTSFNKTMPDHMWQELILIFWGDNALLSWFGLLYPQMCHLLSISGMSWVYAIARET